MGFVQQGQLHSGPQGDQYEHSHQQVQHEHRSLWQSDDVNDPRGGVDQQSRGGE